MLLKCYIQYISKFGKQQWPQDWKRSVFILIPRKISAKECSSSVKLLSHVWLSVNPWTEACQASLSITNSWSSLRLKSVKSVMPSSHLILCRPLLLLPPIPPSIRVFSNESALRIRWPKYWSFSFSIIPSKEIPGLSPSEWTGWNLLYSKSNNVNVNLI